MRQNMRHARNAFLLPLIVLVVLTILVVLLFAAARWYDHYKYRFAMAYGRSQTFLGCNIASYEHYTGHIPHNIGGLSWRVELLRSDGDEKDLALFKQFHLDEPWDSPHNKELIKKIPWWLQDPEGGDPGYTCYRGVTGKNCAFDDGKVVKPVRTGYPIAIVMTKDCCPWTKPEDVSVEEVEKEDCIRWFALGNTYTYARAKDPENSVTIGLSTCGGQRGWVRTNPTVVPTFRFAPDDK
jgi:hypothetical protein